MNTKSVCSRPRHPRVSGFERWRRISAVIACAAALTQFVACGGRSSQAEHAQNRQPSHRSSVAKSASVSGGGGRNSAGILPSGFISPAVPHDVTAGKHASIQQLAVFAWREFIALNWPALDPATTGKRGRADVNAHFVSIAPDANGNYPLLVWETYRHKNELFPASGRTDPDFDSRIPTYSYKGGPYTAAGGASWHLFNNLDEASQIGLDIMYAHNSTRILYEAKVNRALYDYANSHKLTECNDKEDCPILFKVRQKTAADLAAYGGICSNDPTIISLPCGNLKIAGDAGEGTIEIKAAWRRLTPAEMASHRFYTRKVIYYTGTQYGAEKYHNAVFGLVALHIIHKTVSFPDFVFATWEQVDDYDDAANKNSQDLRFVNTGTKLPNIPVKRAHGISAKIATVNAAAHAAFIARDPHTVWQYYRLVGVQATPIAGPPEKTAPAYLRSYYYLANIVVETNQTLQNFYGKTTSLGIVTPGKNVYLHGAPGSPYQMGGCEGCHGAMGQLSGGDMSRLIAAAPSNSNQAPETIDGSAAASIRSYRLRSESVLPRQ